VPSLAWAKESFPALTQAGDYCLRGLPWVGKGALAVLDQGLSSGSNFLITILLARWLTAEQYGAYALAFSIFLLLAGAHESLISEPMMVFGPSSYGNHRREYLGVVLWIEGALGLVFVGVLVCAALIAHHYAAGSDLARALAGLCVSTPCVFLFWVARYAFYLEQCPGRAAAGSTLYSVLLLAGTLLVYRRGVLSPFTAFIVIACGAMTTAVFMLVRLKPVLKRGSNPGLKSVWNRHWHYGRWALGTAGMRWVPGNVSYILTGTLLGLADVGTLKALLNFFLPLGHVANSFGLVFQPYLSGVFGREGGSATKAPVRLVTLLYLGGGSLYWVLLTVFRVPFLRLLYGEKFLGSAYLVPWACCGAVLTVVSYAPSMGLRAIQSPSLIFVAYCVAGVVSVVFGTAAIWLYGLAGAIGSFVLSGMAVLAVAGVLYARKVRPLVSNDCRE
jgi:O-antigen/teichoic acid export membrane protein